MAINILAAVFGKAISPAMLQGYALGLDGLSAEALERAVKRAIKECRFMPSPAELRDLAGEGQDLPGRAALAWQTVLDAVQFVGWYRSIDFEDKAINAAIRALGGWQWLCERAAGDQLPFLRRDFLNLYQAYARAGVPDFAALPLAGEFERENILLGYHREEDQPVQIGEGGASRKQIGASTPTDADVAGLVAQVAESVSADKELER